MHDVSLGGIYYRPRLDSTLFRILELEASLTNVWL